MTWRPPVDARPTDTFRAGKRLWSTADDALLRARYPHEATGPLAGELRRSLVATYQRAQTLGLEKTAAYLASPAACRLRREATPASVATRFKKGQVPANKGLRRPGWAPGRMRETQFTRGARPHTWVPIGTEVVDRDGYHKRKIADDRTRPPRFNWKFVHVLVWETAHGPIPAGHAVTFRNGDKADVSLDNLTLITRVDLMKRNSVHNLPKELASTIQLLGALKRQIRRRTHADESDQRSA